jgi:hypothetical protein
MGGGGGGGLKSVEKVLRIISMALYMLSSCLSDEIVSSKYKDSLDIKDCSFWDMFIYKRVNIK